MRQYHVQNNMVIPWYRELLEILEVFACFNVYRRSFLTPTTALTYCTWMCLHDCERVFLSMCRHVCMHAQNGPAGSSVSCRAQCQSQGPLSPQLCVNSRDHSAPDSSFYKHTSDITHTLMTHTLQLPHASFIHNKCCLFVYSFSRSSSHVLTPK